MDSQNTLKKIWEQWCALVILALEVGIETGGYHTLHGQPEVGIETGGYHMLHGQPG